MSCTITVETDFSELKVLRCFQRHRSIRKDRAEYRRDISKRRQAQAERSQSNSAQNDRTRSAPASSRLANQHRAARTELRSWLANKEINGEADMPSISISVPTVARQRADSETSCGKHQGWDEVNSDADTQVPEEGGVFGDNATDTSSPVLAFIDDNKIAIEELPQTTEFMLEESPHIPHSESQSNEFSTLVARPRSLSEVVQVEQPPQEQQRVHLTVVSNESQNTTETYASCDSHEASKREAIMREIVTKLRQQARDMEHEAAEAKARSREVEQKVAAQSKKQELSARKLALQAEKQRSAQLRKQRNQVAHVQTIKDTTQRALQEAAAIREQAEFDALSMRAQVLAEASIAAQEQAEAQVQAELMAAQAEADALAAEAMEAERAKAEAEAEAQALKIQANEARAAAAEAKAQAEALHVEAQQAAQTIRQGAMKDVLALKLRVEEQLQQKLEAQDRARQEAEAARAAEAQREAEVRAKRDAAEALKLTKVLEQQRARKFHKQAEQERRQQSCQAQKLSDDLEAFKAQVEEEKKAIRQQAFAEVAAMRAKAKEEAEAAQAQAIAAARAEALEKARASTAALKEEAERMAATIKAEAARDAEELLRQAEVERAQAEAAKKAMAAEDEDVAAVLPTPASEEDWHVVAAEVKDGEWDLVV